MGGKSTKTSVTKGSTESKPWEPTIGKLEGIINQIDPNTVGATGAETGAFDALMRNAQAGNPYAPAIGQLATDLLSGGTDRTGIVKDAYAGLQSGLQPYTTMDTNPYSNEAFVKATDTMTGDIADRIKSGYAGAGYSPVRSGDFAQTLGRGVSQGIAPAWLQASNDLENRKLGAIGSLFAGGNQTAGMLSALDQTALGNRQAGIGASTAAQQAKDSPHERILQVEGMRRNLPIQNMAQLENLLIPAAQLGGTTSSEQTTTQTQKTPLGQQIMGGLMGGVGMLGNMGAFGPAGWLLGGGGGLLGGGPMNLGNSGGTGLFGRGFF